MVFRRHLLNPIIRREDIPPIPPEVIDCTSVFNPGATLFRNRIRLMLRVQNRARETFLLMAESEDSIHFQIENRIVQFKGLENIKGSVYHCYDPRITFLEGAYYIHFAMDMDDGCHLGLARTEDFEQFEFLGITTKEDTRNGVLFPEKWDDYYWRLERPNQTQLAGGPVTGDTIILSRSTDLLQWEPVEVVATGRYHYWDELIGPGTPPVKTRDGWLVVYHGVATHFASANIYQAGLLLLDLENPARILARSHQNILEPREWYELSGQVPNVVFPTGMIVERIDENGFAAKESPVKLYYGAADTYVCLALSTIEELLWAVKNY